MNKENNITVYIAGSERIGSFSMSVLKTVERLCSNNVNIIMGNTGRISEFLILEHLDKLKYNNVAIYYDEGNDPVIHGCEGELGAGWDKRCIGKDVAKELSVENPSEYAMVVNSTGVIMIWDVYRDHDEEYMLRIINWAIKNEKLIHLIYPTSPHKWSSAILETRNRSNSSKTVQYLSMHGGIHDYIATAWFSEFKNIDSTIQSIADLPHTVIKYDNSNIGEQLKPDSSVFISGSCRFDQDREGSLVEVLDHYICIALDHIINVGAKILIGDAPGADTMVQKYLNKREYKNVEVYHIGTCRCNIGYWKTFAVDPSDYPAKETQLEAKDIRMTELSDCGLVIYNGKSVASRKNFDRLIEQGKPVCMLRLGVDCVDHKRLGHYYEDCIVGFSSTNDIDYSRDVTLRDVRIGDLFYCKGGGAD